MARHFEDLLRVFLSTQIARMCFACEDKLHGTLRVAHDLGQSREVVKDQWRALVGGEASRKSDSERVGIKHGRARVDARWIFAPPLGRTRKSFACEAHQRAAQGRA